VKIAQQVVNDILAHAREDAPKECCGLLIGGRDEVERNVRARNREAGYTRYLIDPDDHFAAIHSARADNKHVIGAYHSHPASPAIPSESDIAEASGWEFLYVIVSLAKPEGEIFAYRLKQGNVVPVPLVVQ
jgi:proteasome lid subunit RPN8/RPN11